MNNQTQFIWYLCVFVLAVFLQQCIDPESPGSEATDKILLATEEIRIGKMEGDDEYIFGSINHIAVGKDGVIFVGDRQVPVIRMYDKDGHFVRNVGREGAGPGEYYYFGGIRTFPDGRLAVWDQRNLRVSVFDPFGDFIESHNVNSTLFSADIFEVDHEGHFYVRKALRYAPDMPNWKFGWLKISPEGATVDTIKVPLDTEEREQTFVLFTASGDAHAFIEWPLFRMSPMGYLITGRNDRYVLDLHLPDSSPLRIERDFTPVQIKPEERRQWEAWVDYYSVNNFITETKPAYKKILTDSQGRIWVWRYVEAEYTEKNIAPHFGPESRWWEPPTFDVFLPDGSFYATVKLPFDANFRDAKDNYVWAIVKGEYDEQYVARYRLEDVME